MMKHKPTRTHLLHYDKNTQELTGRIMLKDKMNHLVNYNETQ